MQLDGLASLPALDRLTALAGYTFDAPVAFVSILGDVQQRFLSRIGLPMAQTDIRASICAHAVTSDGVLVVPDLRQDPRFRDNPLVAHSPHLRFYAGAPLVARNGVAIGALCVMDTRPRTFDAGDQDQLTTLAELVIAQLELRAMSGRLDPVSGLPSRHQFHADLPGILARCAEGTAYAVAVDILDIPRANQVGQVLGLRPLEALIRRAGVRLRAALDGVAAVYHVGVTRFAFVVDMPDAAQVEALILELRTRMLRPLMAAAVPMSPRFHAGICAVDPGQADSHDLLRRLLVSMHGAFDARQPFCWYSQQRDEKMHRAYRLASDAERGLQAGDFHLEYQPRFTLHGGRPVSAEALIRWTHPTLGAISPGEFIPVFQRTALMDEVTDWVLDKALDQVRDWRALGCTIPVSLNLSSSYLSGATAWEQIRGKLEHRSLPFSMIEIEITEGEWLRPGSPAIAHITAMSQAGIKVAIDDFGSGYSNFSYLSDLPIHTVKLDKSLIDGVATNARARAKVSAIHHLAHELGYLTVAEGVEQPEQLDALADLGVDEVQGYLLARPMLPALLMRVFGQPEPHGQPSAAA
ncbi:MAG: sensor domain-containing phosphodiesterase [Stenotrophomonas sp.]|nr:sensor domain-containing phosphodiesterase [Stenotrophomonas sp.]